MGKMEIWPPVKSKPLNRLTHNLTGLITSMIGTFAPNLVKIRSQGTSGKGVKYNFLCDYFFLGPTYVEKRPLDGFWRAMAQNYDAESRKDVPFWGYKMKNWNLAPIYLKTLKIWPWIGNFQPKWWNMKLQVYQKVLNQSRWKFNTMLEV